MSESFMEVFRRPKGRNTGEMLLAQVRINQAIAAVRMALFGTLSSDDGKARRGRQHEGLSLRTYVTVPNSPAYKAKWQKYACRLCTKQDEFASQLPVVQSSQEQEMLIAMMCGFIIEKTRELARSRMNNGASQFIVEDLLVILHLLFSFKKLSIGALAEHDISISRLYRALKPLYDDPGNEMSEDECEKFRDTVIVPLHNIYIATR